MTAIMTCADVSVALMHTLISFLTDESEEKCDFDFPEMMRYYCPVYIVYILCQTLFWVDESIACFLMKRKKCMFMCLVWMSTPENFITIAHYAFCGFVSVYSEPKIATLSKFGRGFCILMVLCFFFFPLCHYGSFSQISNSIHIQILNFIITHIVVLFSSMG